ncbi:MFS transporter [Reyranella sp. CPCC 100927]|uniref:MFS transporter n=1 Tax=Reyranella sp. CPCC 100927 TaxID=2599616 RepID=UPI0011B59167|nr:MFS transporter [Reyranella sp. CPCC 100927]TWT10535.1 MFS transporter [Reyranella sp. CPCC 100927]
MSRSYLVPFVNTAHAIDHLVMLIFPTIVIALSQEFAMPYGELLALSLGGFIAFGACSLPAGWLGDRWSRHKMMVVFFLATGVTCILTGFVETPMQMAVMLTVLGVSAAIYHPIGNAMLAGLDPAKIGRTMGINGLWGNLGVAFAALVAGALTDWISWRAAFIAPGVISIVAGVGFMALVKEEKPVVAKRSAASGPSFDRTMLVRLFVILMVSTALNGVIFSATTLAMPKVFAERLSSLVSGTFGVGLLVSAVYAFAAFAQLCIGPVMDRWSTRAVFLPIVALQVPLLLLAGYAGGWTIVLVAVPMMFFVFGQIVVNEVMVARYAADEVRSRVYAVRYCVSFGASAVAIPLVAILYGWGQGFTALFLVLGVSALGLVASALWFPSNPTLAAAER